MKKKIIILTLVLLFAINCKTLKSQTPEIIIQGSHSEAIIDLAFSDDEKLLATISSNKTLIIWDINSQLQLANTDVPITGKIIFMNDYNILITNEDYETYIFYIAENKLIKEDITAKDYNFYWNDLFITNEETERVEIRNFKLKKFLLKNEEYKLQFKKTTQIHDNYYQCFGCSPLNDIILAADESGKIYEYKYQRGRYLGVLQNEQTEINSIRFSPSENYFAVIDINNKIDIWQTINKQKIKTLQNGVYQKTAVAINPFDNKLIVGESTGNIYLFDYSTENINYKQINIHNNLISDIEIVNNQSKFFSTSYDNHAIEYDYSINKTILNIVGDDKHKNGVIYDIAIASNNKFACFAGSDSKIIDLDSGKTFTFTKRDKYDKIKIYYNNAIEVNSYLDIAKEYIFTNYPECEYNLSYDALIDIDTVESVSSDPMGGTTTTTEYIYSPMFGESNDFYFNKNNGNILFCTDQIIGQNDTNGYKSYITQITASLIETDTTRNLAFIANEKQVMQMNFNELGEDKNTERVFFTDDQRYMVSQILPEDLIYKSYKSHSEQINDIYMDNKNYLMATASNDGTIKLWNTYTNELIFTLIISEKGYILINKKGYFTGTPEAFDNIAIKREMTVSKADKNCELYLNENDFFKTLKN